MKENMMENREAMNEPKVKWVDLIRYDAAMDEIVPVVRVVLEDGKVRFDVSSDDDKVSTVVADLEKGIPVFTDEHPKGRLLTPADGEEFLDILRKHLRDPHLIATEVRQGDKLEPFVQPKWEEKR